MNFLLKFYLLIFIFPSFTLCAQCIIQGYIVEEKSKEPISFVHILTAGSQSTISDENGFFKLNLKEGENLLKFQHLGFQSFNKKMDLSSNITLELNIELKQSIEELETVVLSAGKFEQKLEEITVSLDVFKGDYIENLSNYNVERSIAQAPSIHIIDGQINIRGGSGWSYGAGSRVLVLLDGLPLTNSVSGAVQWELIPAENIDRIEIIKGASSVLFGSSALNGVINITSKKAEIEPRTNFSTYYGRFDQAKRVSLNWWTQANIELEQYGVNFNHAHKKDKYSYNFGIQSHKSEGYQGIIIESDSTKRPVHIGEERIRIYLNTEILSNRIKGLSYGINSSYLRFDEQDGFLYLSDSLGYTSFSEASFSRFKSAQTSISPRLKFRNSNNNTQHQLMGRLLQTNFNPDGSQLTNNYIALYSEYLFQKFYSQGTWTSGANLNHYIGLSDFFNNDKTGINYALFSQYDFTLSPLRYSIGMRYEQYNIRDKREGKPVVRMGLNYELNHRNFFRASIGQGYRFPSMYELFLYKDAGEISIYSNPLLKPETGYSAEIGFKHKWIHKKQLKTYIDIAIFHMQYNDMVEYSYGLWGDSTRLNPLGIGFKPINVGQTKISGIEGSILLEGKLAQWDLSSRLSYTYMSPRATNANLVYDNYNNQLDNLVANLVEQGQIDETLIPIIEQIAAQQSELSFNSTSSNPDSEILKYRYRHIAKLDLQLSRNQWTLGAHIHYNSFMENVDNLFESGAFNAEVLDIFTFADANIFDTGIKKSRTKLTSGDFITDMRISYRFKEILTFQFLVENIFNREYQIRPASIGAPRLYSIKLTTQF